MASCIKTLIVVLTLTAAAPALCQQVYRAPTAGDKGTYFLLSKEVLANKQFKVLTSRVGKGGEYTDFTELKVDCESKRYFELAGGSEDGQKDKPSAPLKDWSGRSKWTSLVPGSSKSDLVRFVCGGSS